MESKVICIALEFRNCEQEFCGIVRFGEFPQFLPFYEQHCESKSGWSFGSSLDPISTISNTPQGCVDWCCTLLCPAELGEPFQDTYYRCGRFVINLPAPYEELRKIRVNEREKYLSVNL